MTPRDPKSLKLCQWRVFQSKMDPRYKTMSSSSLGVKVTHNLRGNSKPDLVDQHRLYSATCQDRPALDVQQLCLVVSLQNPYGLGKVYTSISNGMRFDSLKRVVAVGFQPFCLILQLPFSFSCGKNDRLPLVLLWVEHGMVQIDLSATSYNCPDRLTTPQEILKVFVSGIPGRRRVVSQDSGTSQDRIGGRPPILKRSIVGKTSSRYGIVLQVSKGDFGSSALARFEGDRNTIDCGHKHQVGVGGSLNLVEF